MCALLAGNSPYHLTDAKYVQVTGVCLLLEKTSLLQKLPFCVLFFVFL